MADPWASLWTDDDPPTPAGVGAGADPWASLWADDGEEDEPWWSVDIPNALRSGAAGLVGFPGRISAAGRAMSALPISLTGMPNPQWFGERLPGAAGGLFRGGRETSEELAKTYIEEPLAAKAAEIAPENPARLFERPIQAIAEGLLGSAGEIALAAVHPVAGGAVAAASGAGGSLQDFETQGVPEERARLAALGIGGIQGLLQGVSGGLLKSLPILSATSKKAAGEMIAKAFAAAGFPDMGAEAATIALETAATGKAPTVRTIAERLLQEGLTEGVAGGAVHAARSLAGTPSPDVSTPEPEPTPQEALEEVRRAIAETPGPVAIPEPGKVASLISRWLTPRGGLGEGQVTGEGGSAIEGATGGGSDTDLFRKLESIGGMGAAAYRMAQLDVAGWERAKKAFAKKVPGTDLEQVNRVARLYMTDPEFRDQVQGGEAEALPAELVAPLEAMWQSRRAQAQQLIDSGALPEEWAQIYGERLDTHLTRAYLLHDDPKRLAKVENTQLWEEVRRDLTLMAKDLPSLADHVGDPQALANAVEGLMRSSMEPTEMATSWSDPLSGRYAGTIHPGTFKHRKDVPEPLRRLWGEYQDVGIGYLKAQEKNIRTLYQAQAFQAIRESELGKTMFTEPTSNASVQIPGSGGPTSVRPGIGGLFTTRHLAQALEHAFTGAHQYGTIGQVSGAVKAGMTIGSPRAQVRNVESNLLALLANGHLFNVGAWGGARVAFADFMDRGDGEMRASIERLHRHKLAGGVAVDIGDMKHILGEKLEEMGRGGDVPRTVAGRAMAAAGRGIGGAARLARKGYELGDVIFKAVGLEAEMSLQRRADPSASGEVIENRAAEVVRQVYQNYDRLPRFVKELRALPGIGPFVSFPVASAINLANTAKIAGKDLASGDPRRAAVGLQRVAGLAATGAVVTTMASTSAFLVGKLAAPLIAQLTGEEPPEPERLLEASERIRRVLPPYMRNSQLAVIKLGQGGEVGVVDLSYLNYYSAVADPILTAAREMRLDDASLSGALAEGLRELLEPFVSFDPAARAVVEAAIGSEIGPGLISEQQGQELHPEDASLPLKLAAKTWHVASEVAPGFLAQPARLAAGLAGKEGPTGRTYDPQVEALSFFGPRPLSIDYPKRLEGEGKKWRRETADAAGEITKASRQLGPLADRRVQEAEVKLRDRYRHLQLLTEDAAFFGMTAEDADRRLHGSLGHGVGQKTLGAVRALGPDVAVEQKILETRQRVLGDRHQELLLEWRDWRTGHPSALATEAKKERERLASRWERTWALLGEGPVPPLSF